MPYDNVTRKHYDSGDYRASLALAREKLDLPAWRARQARGEGDARRIGVLTVAWSKPGMIGSPHAEKTLVPCADCSQ